MARRLIGIDIGYDRVSAAVVSTGFKGTEIEARAVADLPGGLDSPQLPEALATLTETVGAPSVPCTVAIPAHRLSFRHLQVPFSSAKQIRQVLPMELAPLLSRSGAEGICDFIITGPGGNQGSDILAAVIDTDRLRDLIAALTDCGLSPEQITIGGLAPARLIIQSQGDSPNFVLIDLGRRQSTLVIAQEGQIATIRAIDAGTVDAGPDGVLIREITRTLDAFDHGLPTPASPRFLVVTGEPMPDAAVVTDLAEGLRLPVRELDTVLDKVPELRTITTEGQGTETSWAAAAVAVGAIRGADRFNLLRGPFAAKSFLREYRGPLIRTALLITALLVTWIAGTAYDIHTYRQEAVETRQRIETLFRKTLPEETRIVDPVRQMQIKLRGMRTNPIGSTMTEKTPRVTAVLSDLSRLIPKRIDVVVKRVIIGPGNVQISGDTDTFNAVNEMRGLLAADKAFSSVDISSANQDKTGKRVNFKLKIKT